VGDALGLPCEALNPEKQRKYFGEISSHRLLFGRGMYSDDTEHTIIIAQALIESGGEPEQFLKSFARQLRGWILLLPGGVGLATLKACWKLVFGVSPQRSGIHSAGNGPAMRAAMLGVFSAVRGFDIEQLRELNRLSTRVTHTDPKAEYGAFAIALAAYYATEIGGEISPREYIRRLCESLAESENTDEFLLLMAKVAESVENHQGTSEFVQSLGWSKGATGYIYHTVPAALHAWLSHPTDYRAGVLEIIHCGGDTDSTAAIVGGLIGAVVGADGIPQAWRDGLLEWPRGEAWLENLADRLAQVGANGAVQKSLPVFSPSILARNLFFLGVVLVHGFRRLLPI
jgi:ADP-ribosylglycohydrolase